MTALISLVSASVEARGFDGLDPPRRGGQVTSLLAERGRFIFLTRDGPPEPLVDRPTVLSPVRPVKTDQAAHESERGVVHELRPLARGMTDADLVASIRGGAQTVVCALFDRHGRHVERLLYGLVGPEPEAEDLLHEVFLQAIESIGSLEDPNKLRSWLNGITVHVARQWIRKRSRRRWLSFVDEVPEPRRHAGRAFEEVNEATRCTFEVLRAMSADARVLFSLRFIEGMELAEVATACDLSLSTAKRHLKDAEKTFVHRARRFPALRPWLDEGGRWSSE